jgi:hypothetical protein
MNRIFGKLTALCAVMLAAGVTLPFVFYFLPGGLNLPPAVWNFLQVGGGGGFVVFGVLYRLTKARDIIPKSGGSDGPLRGAGKS